MTDFTKHEMLYLKMLPKLLKEVMELCHAESVNKGFWATLEDDEPKDIAVKLALLHSEVSEALEAVRLGNPLDSSGEYDSLTVELADVFIRLMDMSAIYAPNLPQAVIHKLRYNRTRPYRHGDKAF